MRVSKLLTMLGFSIIALWTATASAATPCSPGEKRLHESDPECIPASLHSYLTCLGPSAGIEVVTAVNWDKSKRFDIRLGAGASVRLVSGEGAAGFSKENADKLEEIVRTTYSTDHVKNCARWLPVQGDQLRKHDLLQAKLPNVSGAFSRDDAEIVFNNWQYQNCTLRLIKHELLELRVSDSGTSSMTGTLHVFFSAKPSYDGADTVDIFKAYREPSYRSPKAACETLHPQLEEYRSLITISITATGLAYEELVQSPTVRQPTLQRKEGDRWSGTLKFLDSNRSIQFDGARIFTHV